VITVTALFQAVKDDIRNRYPDLGTTQCETWDADRYAAAALVEGFLKKNQETIDTTVADACALRTFLEVNERVGLWAKRQLHEWEEELWGTFKDELYRFFYPRGEPLFTSWNVVASFGDLGPGASLGANGTDFYTKLFSSNLTATSESLYNTYRRTLTDPKWREAEETRQALGFKEVFVDANKLSYVPKNDRTSRTICTEPTLNMFFQRGLSKIMESRLRDYGIDLSIQPDLNRDLARIGSAGDCISSIDLSSASDSVSNSLLAELLPAQVHPWFQYLRVPYTVLPDGTRVKLNMHSTMGNGYTFSLQTVLFTCMVLASFRVSGCRRLASVVDKRQKNWGVFGDDILVPKGQVTRYVLALLDIAGFRVNSEKTFVEGPFRESCGGDFLLGRNVRPVFARTVLTQETRYTLLNRLNWWCKEHFVLPQTLAVLNDELGNRPHIVPPLFPDDSGIRTSWTQAVRLLPKDRNGSIRCRFRKAVTYKVAVSEDTLRTPALKQKERDKRRYNSAGLLIAFVQGYARGTGPRAVTGTVAEPDPVVGHIPTRNGSDHVRYRTCEVTIPNWDYSQVGG
jgi:hypothetical protein